MSWDKQLERKHGDLKSWLHEEPYIVVQATLGDRPFVASDYRPQLWIGQTLRNGERLYWDGIWLIHRKRLDRGESGTITVFVRGLPISALCNGEKVEFYEGQRKTAEGHILRIRSDGHAHDTSTPGPDVEPVA
jgi:hypothetical protein